MGRPASGSESTCRRIGALRRAAQRRAQAHDVPYQTALEQLRDIQRLAHERNLTFEAAEALYDDPANQLLCERCGWTKRMACPECQGCGCHNGRCSGWRHIEYMSDDERAELSEDDHCDECGADCSLGSYERCDCA